MQSVYKDGNAIDYLTVTEKLKGCKKLDEIGGSAYITYLLNNTPTYLNADSYAQVVIRAKVRRRLLGVASQITQVATSPNHDIEEVLERTRTITDDFLNAPRNLSNSRFSDDCELEYETYLAEQDAQGDGFTTGSSILDKALGGGIQIGLTIIAGLSGVGKTHVMVQLVYLMAQLVAKMNKGLKEVEARQAKRFGIDFDNDHLNDDSDLDLELDTRQQSIYIVTLEMTRSQLIRRLIARSARLDSNLIRTNKAISALSSSDRSKYTKARTEIMDFLKSKTLVIMEGQGLDASGIKSEVKQHSIANNRRVMAIFIDHLHEMKETENSKAESVESNAGKLQHMSKLDFKCPIVCLAQQRPVESYVKTDNPNYPSDTDIRYSKAVKEKCDFLLFCYDAAKNKAKFGGSVSVDEIRPNSLYFIMHKARDKELPTIGYNIAAWVYFDRSCSFFGNYEDHSVRVHVE
jgi:replicative DNA helicase